MYPVAQYRVGEAVLVKVLTTVGARPVVLGCHLHMPTGKATYALLIEH